MTQRSDTVARQLAPQDGLFTVTERGSGAAPVRVVSSIVEAISGRDYPGTVTERIAAPSTSVVTLTVTEKGYRIDPRTGTLNTADDQVQADLAGRAPQTSIGQIARGIQRRARADAGPLTVVSCDNLPGNGELTRNLVHAFAAALPAKEADPLLSWLTANVSFPSTMVDRMVPATTAGDLDAVERELGLRDEAAVVAEPFLQWVIEDNFTSRRPRWEDAGALFSSDVAAWEAAKLRLLNASHSMLAYLGLATGKATISDAVGEDAFRTACSRMMAEDALPTISLPAGMDGITYCAQVLSRFANPALGHTTDKVGSDGSQKIGLRLLTTVRGQPGRRPRAPVGRPGCGGLDAPRCLHPRSGAERSTRAGSQRRTAGDPHSGNRGPGAPRLPQHLRRRTRGTPGVRRPPHPLVPHHRHPRAGRPEK